MRYKLGEGIFSWPRSERVTDRYGCVQLLNSEGDSITEPTPELNGKKGTLFVHVLSTQRSRHIGDLFRGIFPSTPDVGEDIVLGKGALFFDGSDEEVTAIGLLPEDGRETDWLDPNKLYRAHDQTVELFFDDEE